MTASTMPGLDTAALEELLRGEVIRPGDASYDSARAVHNAMIEARPALIVRCADVADVMACVNFARESNVPLAVRGGGHNVAGYGTIDDGLVLDLSGLKGIQVDPNAERVIVQGGCTWADVDHATHAFGLAAPGGVVSTTGVGGLTLGGGLGHLSRSCGLSVDNLLSADVVTADGRFLVASEDENEDLFWAIRGGGGNFGVVTSFTFRLHPVGTIVGGPMLWSLEQAADVLRMYDQVLADAPDELTGVFAFLLVPPGPPFPEDLQLQNMCGIVWCWTGDHASAEAALARAREIEPAFDLVGPMPFPMLQSMFDPIAGPGSQNYWRADFFDGLSDEAIAAFVEHGANVPNIFSGLHLYPIDGVAGRVPSDATAFSYRDARWAGVFFSADPDGAHVDELKGWVVGTSEALHPHSSGGAYVNFLSAEGDERIRAAYRDNYERLATIKQRYDPKNLFRRNQNIQPAG